MNLQQLRRVLAAMPDVPVYHNRKPVLWFHTPPGHEVWIRTRKRCDAVQLTDFTTKELLAESEGYEGDVLVDDLPLTAVICDAEVLILKSSL